MMVVSGNSHHWRWRGNRRNRRSVRVTWTSSLITRNQTGKMIPNITKRAITRMSGAGFVPNGSPITICRRKEYQASRAMNPTRMRTQICRNRCSSAYTTLSPGDSRVMLQESVLTGERIFGPDGFRYPVSDGSKIPYLIILKPIYIRII